MEGHEALAFDLHLHGPSSCFKLDFGSRRPAVNLKEQQWSGGHKGIPCTDGLGEILESKFVPTEVSVSPVCACRHIRAHLVCSAHSWQPVAAVQIAVPIQETQIVEMFTEGVELKCIDFAQD